MKKPDLVNYRGTLMPRSALERAVGEGQCPVCGDAGEIPEQLSAGRLPEMVPCTVCRTFCAKCGKWVERKGHEHG